MVKEFWLSLPVKDLHKSKEFFSKLGLSFHPRHEGSDDMAGLLIGEKNMMVMLCPEPTFRSFTGNRIADTKQGTEVLLSFDTQSREEVDELIAKAEQAGGIIYGRPQEKDGWLYGAGFTDLDGHRWNVLYMDRSKMK